MKAMQFTLFKKTAFRVRDPLATIEAYCFQSDFYENYDLQRPQDDESFNYVRFIGARIREKSFNDCKRIIEEYRDFELFRLDLESYLRNRTSEEQRKMSLRLNELCQRLDNIEGVGFSKATKILHTRYPKIIPMIDNPLQKEYKTLRGQAWQIGDWAQLFNDYYDNFLPLEGETYQNLCQIQRDLSFLGLTKVRIFDILWWSYLKAKHLCSRGIKWKTISFEV